MRYAFIGIGLKRGSRKLESLWGALYKEGTFDTEQEAYSAACSEFTRHYPNLLQYSVESVSPEEWLKDFGDLGVPQIPDVQRFRVTFSLGLSHEFSTSDPMADIASVYNDFKDDERTQSVEEGGYGPVVSVEWLSKMR